MLIQPTEEAALPPLHLFHRTLRVPRPPPSRRHCFLLGPAGTAQVQAMVVAMLEDAKLEVREMAATTLSGLLKGLPKSEAEALRRSFIERALQLFPPGAAGAAATAAKRRRTAAAAVSATGAGGAGAEPAQLPGGRARRGQDSHFVACLV